jgi:hypothetical protein
MLAILAVMVGTGIHEIFEGPDATPFALDPDYILLALGTILTICLGKALITLHRVLLAFLLVVVRTLRFDDSAHTSLIAASKTNLLFSPPPKFLPLRI